jgi:hypothetical protein
VCHTSGARYSASDEQTLCKTHRAQLRKRVIKCANGNRIERFYDRRSRSSVTIVFDAAGDQLGEAAYDGNKVSAAFSMKHAIAANGGEALVEVETCARCDWPLPDCTCE